MDVISNLIACLSPLRPDGRTAVLTPELLFAGSPDSVLAAWAPFCCMPIGRGYNLHGCHPNLVAAKALP